MIERLVFMDIWVWLAVVNVAFFIGWIWNRIRIITVEGQVAILEGKVEDLMEKNKEWVISKSHGYMEKR